MHQHRFRIISIFLIMLILNNKKGFKLNFCFFFIDDWRCDQYKWKKNHGTKKLPRKSNDPVVIKYYHSLNESSLFRREAWRLTKHKTNIVLVHYIGDHTTYIPEAYGNAKNNMREHVRTCPSVIDNLKINDQGSHMKTYQNQYKQKIPPALISVLKARNYKQVENSQIDARNKELLSHDEILILYLLADQWKTFIKKIDIYPDLLFYAANSELLKEFNEILLINDSGIYCSYDTTFNLGDFYVTPIVFRHIVFKENPTIPLFFMIHQRKYQALHEQFLNIILKEVPNIHIKKVPIVCDREVGILNAIKAVLPNCPILICWNHIKRDIKQWLKYSKASSSDISIYMDHIKQLIQSGTEEEFDTLFDILSQVWTESFLEYFSKYIKESFKKQASIWYIRSLNIPDLFSGITNNASESINNVLKQLHDRKEARCDTFAISIFNLQIHYLTEIKRGYCKNGGEYNLKYEYQALAEDPGEIRLPEPTSPSKIIGQIRQNLANFDEAPEVLGTKANIISKPSEQQIPHIYQKPILSQVEKAKKAY